MLDAVRLRDTPEVVDDHLGRKRSDHAFMGDDLIARHQDLHVPAKGVHPLCERGQHLRCRRSPALRRNEIDSNGADAGIRQHPQFRILDIGVNDGNASRRRTRVGPARPRDIGCRCHRSTAAPPRFAWCRADAAAVDSPRQSHLAESLGANAARRETFRRRCDGGSRTRPLAHSGVAERIRCCWVQLAQVRQPTRPCSRPACLRERRAG